jgi:hypothetical protein
VWAEGGRGTEAVLGKASTKTEEDPVITPCRVAARSAASSGAVLSYPTVTVTLVILDETLPMTEWIESKITQKTEQLLIIV